MSRMASDRWRRTAYQHAVTTAFRTVPLYRERWALDGRTDPVLVPGRTGVVGGAIRAEEAQRRLADLVPLSGGTTTVEPLRGLGHVLSSGRHAGRMDLVVALEDGPSRELTGLPVGMRGRTCRADELGTVSDRSRRVVVAVGPDHQLTPLHDGLPPRVRPVSTVELARLSDAVVTHGLLHDPLLGFLGARRRCGEWHLDWPRVHARETSARLAVTVLWQRSPRFVDILVGGGIGGVVTPCPTHGTPVVRT